MRKLFEIGWDVFVRLSMFMDIGEFYHWMSNSKLMIYWRLISREPPTIT